MMTDKKPDYIVAGRILTDRNTESVFGCCFIERDKAAVFIR